MLFRAFHALPIFTTRDGQPTNAIHGFLMTLFKVTEDLEPDYLLVALDRPEMTFREEAYAEYKGTRQEAADAFLAQVPLFLDALPALGIPALGVPGYEADDVMGSLARVARAEGIDVDILTGDRDILQLVGPGVDVLLMRGADRVDRMDAAAVVKLFGVLPEQVPDYKALVGDVSDNIPGVKGIGEKSAVKLLEGGRHLEELLRDIESLPKGRVRDLLREGREKAELSKRLATIETGLDLGVRVDALTYRRPRPDSALPFLKRLELRTVIRRLGLDDEPSGPVTSLSQIGVPERAPLQDLALAEEVAVAFDGDRLGLASKTGAGVFPLSEGAEILAGPTKKLWHDAKADVRRLAEAGIKVQNVAFDTALAAYLLMAGQDSYRLESLAESYLATAVPGPEGDDGLATRAEVVLRLAGRLGQALDDEGLRPLMDEVEMPLLMVLAQMERNGITVDREAIVAIDRELAEEIEHLLGRIHTLAGHPFNPNSTLQLRQVLFEELGLPVQKRTKTGPSTDADVLETLAPMHEIVREILRNRQLQKLRSTYTEGLLPLIAEDGKLHTTFGQMVASTGRLASSDPNLQNIPVRLEEGRRLRKAFRPSGPGRQLLTADYSQIELRVLAHLSEDPVMIEAFENNEDIHTRTAAEVFALAPHEVTPEQRRRAKAVNFGIVYGISDFGLARNLAIPIEEARDIIRRYFERYPGVKAYMDGAIRAARERGYALTLFGRRRYLPDLGHQNRQVRSFAERTAMNTPIQGSAADILKVAMVKVFDVLNRAGKPDRLLLTVHDELIFETPEDELTWLAGAVRREMAGAATLKVPLVVEMKSGSTWYDVVPLGGTHA